MLRVIDDLIYGIFAKKLIDLGELCSGDSSDNFSGIEDVFREQYGCRASSAECGGNEDGFSGETAGEERIASFESLQGCAGNAGE